MSCGQAVVAMVARTTLRAVCDTLGHAGPTRWRELHTLLHVLGVPCEAHPVPVYHPADLPGLGVLGLPTGGVYGHWAAVADGMVYDPGEDGPYPTHGLEYSTYPSRTIYVVPCGAY